MMASGLSADNPDAIMLFIFTLYYFLPAEAVADAAHGLDQAGVGRVFFQLLAQPAHMDIDGARISRVVITPYVVEQLVAGQNRASIAYKVGQQIELFGLEFQFLAAAIDTSPGQVDAQGTGYQFAIGTRNLAACLLCRFFCRRRNVI